MDYKNLQEDLVEEVLSEKLADRKDICVCEVCRADMAIYALNRLPPLYARHTRGRIFTRLQGEGTQGRASVVAAVLNAIKTVSKTPHKDDQTNRKD